MGDPDQAARDPIFWLHHANIDRLWKRWLGQGGRQNPLKDNVWMTTKFFFFNENGKKVGMAGKDILDTVKQLNYRYDDDPTPNVTALILQQNPPKEVGMNAPKILQKLEKNEVLGLQPTKVSLALGKETHKNLTKGIDEKKALLLTVDNIRFEKNPGVYYEVYLNLPAGQEPDSEQYLPHWKLGVLRLKNPHRGRASSCF